MKRFSLFSLMLLAAMFVGSAHADIVKNGGFETGDFQDWQVFGTPNSSFVTNEAPHLGSFAALGEVGGVGDIVQTLDTVAGQKYSLKFWLANLGGGVDNADSVASFAVFIGAGAVPNFSLIDKNASGFAEYELLFDASAALTQLAFEFRHDDAFWLLDDVSVTAVPPNGNQVPEPASLLLFLVAGAALLTVARKRTDSMGA
jgi:hypothetical protein